jgi:hypothetical protein
MIKLNVYFNQTFKFFLQVFANSALIQSTAASSVTQAVDSAPNAMPTCSCTLMLETITTDASPAQTQLNTRRQPQ